MHYEATRLPGMQVYTNQGTYLGTVHEVSLELTTHRVDGLYLTETNGALVPEAANVVIPYRWVANLDDIIILRFFPERLSFVEPESEPEVLVAPLGEDGSLESLEFELEPLAEEQVDVVEAIALEETEPVRAEWPDE